MHLISPVYRRYSKHVAEHVAMAVTSRLIAGLVDHKELLQRNYKRSTMMIDHELKLLYETLEKNLHSCRQLAVFSLVTDVFELLKCQTTMLPAHLSFLTKRHPELLVSPCMQSSQPGNAAVNSDGEELKDPVTGVFSCGLALLKILIALREDAVSVVIQSRCRQVLEGRVNHFDG